MDIFACLEEKSAGFSKGQKRIAAYIQENREEASFLTAAKIAKAVGVSESTVVRFALELGYSGFPEMQKALQSRVLRKLSPEKTDGISLALYRDLTELNKLEQTLERELLQASAEAACRAGRVYVYGKGQTAPWAELLNNALLELRPGVVLLKEQTLAGLCRELLEASDGDVFLSIAGDGALRLAKKLGCLTVAFGEEGGDYSFLAAYGEAVPLSVGLAAILHAFLAAARELCREAATEREARILRILQEMEEECHDL